MTSSETEARQRGSALLLFPAGILIVFVLAAMAVDLSAAFLAQRELHDATAAAAADATAALAGADFYGHGVLDVDAPTAGAVARARVLGALDAGRHQALEVSVSVAPSPTAGCGATVTVWARSSIEPVFGAALPGRGPMSVRATSAARPQQSPVC